MAGGALSLAELVRLLDRRWLTLVAEPPAFVCVSWHLVREPIWLALVECDRERPRMQTGLPGRYVLIDGKRFRCISVESESSREPIRQGERIGVVVRRQ
jgi:hypothetical protein